MKKLVLVAFLGFFLVSCSAFRPHKMDVQQGNVFSPAEVNRLHKGMSESQVKDIMGTPAAVNIFNTNRIDYVYTNQPGHGTMTIKRVVCTFKYGQLVDIQYS